MNFETHPNQTRPSSDTVFEQPKDLMLLEPNEDLEETDLRNEIELEAYQNVIEELQSVGARLYDALVILKRSSEKIPQPVQDDWKFLLDQIEDAKQKNGSLLDKSWSAVDRLSIERSALEGQQSES